MCHSAQPPDMPGRGPAPVQPLRDMPTVRSQLDFFAGTWVVRGLPQETTLHGAWHGSRLCFTHPTGIDGHQPRYADTFDYDNPSYVRRDQAAHPRTMMVSGGWVDNRWVWQAVDCSARIIYDRIDDNTMTVTEETGDAGHWRLVRRFEAQRR